MAYRYPTAPNPAMQSLSGAMQTPAAQPGMQQTPGATGAQQPGFSQGGGMGFQPMSVGVTPAAPGYPSQGAQPSMAPQPQTQAAPAPQYGAQGGFAPMTMPQTQTAQPQQRPAQPQGQYPQEGRVQQGMQGQALNTGVAPQMVQNQLAGMGVSGMAPMPQAGAQGAGSASYSESLVANPEVDFPAVVGAPNLIRTTHSICPASQSQLNRFPLSHGCVLQLLNKPKNPIPVVNFNPLKPVRCEGCRGYINAYCNFADAGTRWVCNLCGVVNRVPDQ
ncbi:hypothetical protein KIPB_008257, partial [Kipferlia bialata]|eukprot:g8257.t1